MDGIVKTSTLGGVVLGSAAAAGSAVYKVGGIKGVRAYGGAGRRTAAPGGRAYTAARGFHEHCYHVLYSVRVYVSGLWY